MPEAAVNRPLRVVIAALTLLALAATLYTAFLRATPAAFEPRLDGFAPHGMQLTTLQPSPGQIDDEYAYSAIQRWRAQIQPSGADMFQLDLAAVHSREWMGFDVEQMARHTRFPSIDERREVQTEAGLAPVATVALGQAGDNAVLQSCIVPGGVAHVTRDDLMNAVNAQRVRTRWQRVLELLGLKPNTRWECLLVSISMPKAQASDEALLSAWDKTYAALRERLPAAKQD